MLIKQAGWHVREGRRHIARQRQFIDQMHSVGLPLDLVVIKRDRLETARHMSIDSDNEYFRGIRNRWSEALREAFGELPDPDWLRNPPA